MYKHYILFLLALMLTQCTFAQINVMVIGDSDSTPNYHIDNVRKVGEKYQLEGQDGQLLLDGLDSIRKDAKNGCYMVVKEGKHGVITPFFEYFIPIQYDKLEETFCYPFWLVEKEQKKGVFSVSAINVGKEIIACAYDSIVLTSNYKSKFVVEDNHKWGIRGTTGEEILPVVYDHINKQPGDVYQLQKGDVTTYLFNFNTLVDSIDIEQYHFIPGNYAGEGRYYFIASRNGNKGVLDEDGYAVIPFLYESVILEVTQFKVKDKNGDSTIDITNLKRVPAISQ